MKILAAVVAFPLALGLAPAAAAEDMSMPEFIKQTFPEAAQKAAWAEEQAVMNPKGALDGKTKHLIALGVAAQIPCEYCVYFHVRAAKAQGATEAQIKEAVAAAGVTRKWSTVLNGSAYDFAKFRQQVDARFGGH